MPVSSAATASLSEVNHVGSRAYWRREGRNTKRRYVTGIVLAVGLHLGILYGIKKEEVYTPPEFGVEIADAGVEVTLVAAMPADVVDENAPEMPVVEEEETTPEPEEEVIPEPEPEPPVEEPEPEPPVEEPVPEPEPEPEPEPQAPPEFPVAAPTPKPTPAATPRKVVEKVRERQQERRKKVRQRVARFSGDGSSPVPGRDATTAIAGGGALSSKPGYLRNPHPSYPEEARKAGQQGVVHLRVSINEQGQVAGVAISRSSGFPLLDERARSVVASKWRFRPARRGNAAVATTVVVPIRFSLDRR